MRQAVQWQHSRKSRGEVSFERRAGGVVWCVSGTAHTYHIISRRIDFDRVAVGMGVRRRRLCAERGTARPAHRFALFRHHQLAQERQSQRAQPPSGFAAAVGRLRLRLCVRFGALLMQLLGSRQRLGQRKGVDTARAQVAGGCSAEWRRGLEAGGGGGGGCGRRTQKGAGGGRVSGVQR
jgi:hypothetical protein